MFGGFKQFSLRQWLDALRVSQRWIESVVLNKRPRRCVPSGELLFSEGNVQLSILDDCRLRTAEIRLDLFVIDVESFNKLVRIPSLPSFPTIVGPDFLHHASVLFHILQTGNA